MCARADGFATAGDAAKAEAWLTEPGAAVQAHPERGEVVKDHRVYRPPLPSRAEATATVEEIRAKGVEDIALIRHGDLANGASLGIYRSIDNMRRRVEALESIGVPVQYMTTRETVVTYVVGVRLPLFPAFLRRGLGSRVSKPPTGGGQLRPVRMSGLLDGYPVHARDGCRSGGRRPEGTAGSGRACRSHAARIFGHGLP